MQKMFNLMRANDLIWSFVVNKCLLSQSRWRSTCSIRMQTARECPTWWDRAEAYAGRSRDDQDILSLHLHQRRPYCPWASTYRGSLSFGGPVRFVLGGSGHIAGVINPPSSAKYGYWIGVKRPPEPQARFAGPRQNQGSWWLD
jgi:polyhydroxyalkanoate synthase